MSPFIVFGEVWTYMVSSDQTVDHNSVEMSVYVDGMAAKFGRMVMCHMAADSTEELLEMADKIGVQRKWLQDPGTGREHFDICLAKKALAIKYGAIEASWHKAAELFQRESIPKTWAET